MTRFLLVFALLSAAAASQVLIEPVIVSETLPAGGMMQIKVALTSPHPITTTGNDFSTDSFDSVDGVSLLSPGGDAFGVAVARGGKFTVNLSSPQSTLGTQLDYPYLMIAARIRRGLAPGTLVPINFGPASNFVGTGGAPYTAAVKNGTLTIGGSVSIANIIPGSGLTAPGSAIRVVGTGFTPKTKIDVKGLKVDSVLILSPNDLLVMPKESVELTGLQFTATNPDRSTAVYYSYLRPVAVGESTRGLLNVCHPLYPQQTFTFGILTLPGAPANGFLGVAVKNSAATAVDVELQLDTAAGTLKVSKFTMPRYSQLLRSVEELYGAVPAGATVTLRSTGPVQFLGISADELTSSVTAFIP